MFTLLKSSPFFSFASVLQPTPPCLPSGHQPCCPCLWMTCTCSLSSPSPSFFQSHLHSRPESSQSVLCCHDCFHFACYLFIYILKYHVVVVVQLQLSPFSPHYCLPPYPPPPPTVNPAPLSLSMGPLHMFLDLTLPLLSPIIPLLLPLWSLSVCSLFLCLWFYFAHLFVLLIRFHL